MIKMTGDNQRKKRKKGIEEKGFPALWIHLVLLSDSHLTEIKCCTSSKRARALNRSTLFLSKSYVHWFVVYFSQYCQNISFIPSCFLSILQSSSSSVMYNIKTTICRKSKSFSHKKKGKKGENNIMNKGRMIRNYNGWSILKGRVAVFDSILYLKNVQKKKTFPADHLLVILNFNMHVVSKNKTLI